MEKKRLLYIAFIRLPTEKAHGLQIMKTCEALAEQGIDVELVVPNRKTPIIDDPFKYYQAKESFKLTVLQTPDWIRCGTLGYLFSALWFSEAARWHSVFWKADVIYSRDAWVLLQYLLLGRKLVFEAHRKPTFIDRVVARASFKVITITESLKKCFVEAGVSDEKIVVAHDGVEPFDRAPRTTAPHKPLAVYVGSRKPGKGVETVEAARTLIPEVEIQIVTGQSPGVARVALCEADVVLVPNSAKVEAWALYTSPMKLFEALQSGARVVVSDVPAIREIVTETEVWFFTPDDPESLVKTIRSALSDPSASTKVAAAQELSQRYTWRARAQVIRDFIFNKVAVQ